MDIFQKTALGKFISALTEEERQMLFQCYITDFIVLAIGVSSLEELQVSVWNKSWKPFGWRQEHDACEHTLLYQSCLLRQNPPLRQTNSKVATKQLHLTLNGCWNCWDLTQKSTSIGAPIKIDTPFKAIFVKYWFSSFREFCQDFQYKMNYKSSFFLTLILIFF